MHQEFLFLLLILAAVHLGEGLHLLPRGAWIFRRRAGGGWQALPAHALPRVKGLGLALGGLLPHRPAALAQAPPFLAGPLGLLDPHPALPGPPEAGRGTLDWNQAARLRREERELHAPEGLWCGAVDSSTARRWNRLLREVEALPAGSRQDRLLQELRASLDVREARRRQRRFRRVLPPLLAVAWSQVLLLFGVLPFLMWSGWILTAWPALLLALLLDQILGLALLVRARRRIHPERGGIGLGHMAVLATSPPYLMRLPELLLMDLYAGLHPLAAGMVLLPPEGRKALAETFWRAMAHPLPWEGEDPAAMEAERVELERWMQEQGFSPGELLRAPVAGPGERAHCPRCGARFLRRGGDCSECAGIALEALDQSGEEPPEVRGVG